MGSALGRLQPAEPSLEERREFAHMPSWGLEESALIQVSMSSLNNVQPMPQASTKLVLGALTTQIRGAQPVHIFVAVVLTIFVFSLCVAAFITFKGVPENISWKSDGRRSLLNPSWGKCPGRRFFFSLEKSGLHDILGIDIKYKQGKLEVVQILPSGAIERKNKELASSSPP